MDVGVNEAGEDVLALAIDDVDAVIGGDLGAARLAQLGDAAVPDENVATLVDVAARVEYVGAADEQVDPGPGGAEQLLRAHHATAARIGEPASSS